VAETSGSLDLTQNNVKHNDENLIQNVRALKAEGSQLHKKRFVYTNN